LLVQDKAYQEIPDGHCPLAENLRAVTTLLHSLKSQGAITEQQHKQLSPNLSKLELAHLYFIPKPHKVF
jgi:hypothetical protein